MIFIDHVKDTSDISYIFIHMDEYELILLNQNELTEM